MRSMLVASQNPMACKAIKTCFQSEYRVNVVTTRKSSLEAFKKMRYEFFFIDVELVQTGSGSPDMNGQADYKSALEPFWQVFPTAEIVVMSSQQKIRDAVMAVKAGASNYITYPIDVKELRHIIETAYKSMLIRSELDYFRDKFWRSDLRELVETENPAIKRVFEKIRSLAPMKTTVLLTGETGTGKGLLAKLIHHNSKRAQERFMTVHCGAIPDSLLESELFGHEKGAFTGADRRKLGKFETAQKGTIFLDEIGTITPSAQIKLLQVLQDRTFQRLGGQVTINADVRIIAATNANLSQMSADGRFRKDLYYRLSVFPIEVPPLRDRTEDIPHLSEVFLKRLNKQYLKEIHGIDPRVLEAFTRYSWPGNIRELENLIERSYILESSPMLTPTSFPNELFNTDVSDPYLFMNVSLPLSEIRRQTTEMYLKKLLASNNGRIQESAVAAGISARQLHNLMTKYGIRKKDFRSPPAP
jgi:DNA-binding NtrC family response regulator